MARKYEKILGVARKQAVKRARVVLEAGWQCGKYPSVDISGQIPWGFTGDAERSWNYHVHSLDMIDSLLMAYSETEDVEWLLPCIRIADDWLRYISTENISPFVWYDMAVGIRAYRLAYLYDVACELGLLDDDLKKVMWQVVLEHARYLAKDANISFSSNHGYYQVAGQLAMGRRFSESSAEMKAAWLQGQERIVRMVHQQFTAEGVHKEHSPDYHLMVYETLCGLVDAGLIESEEIVSCVDRIEQALSWFVMPNGKLVNFGDTGDKSVLEGGAARWRTGAMKALASSGTEGCWWTDRMRVYPEGGYFIVRSPAEDGVMSYDSYLAQNAAFHSRVHKHADDLSFVWCDRGINIFVDSGRYGYVGKAARGSALWRDGHWYSDPNRVYCESTRAHNTLEFDGINYRRLMRKPYGSALRRWGHADGVFAVETECHHFPLVQHFRFMLFRPGSWLVVIDCFRDRLFRRHDVRQWFHLSPELRLDADEFGRFVTDTAGKMPHLRVMPLLPCDGPDEVLGRDDEQMQGWFSPSERALVPAVAFNYSLHKAYRGVVATLFSFSEQLILEDCKIECSDARTGDVRWRDEQGCHELKFLRPRRGDISTSYSCGEH